MTRILISSFSSLTLQGPDLSVLIKLKRKQMGRKLLNSFPEVLIAYSMRKGALRSG